MATFLFFLLAGLSNALYFGHKDNYVLYPHARSMFGSQANVNGPVVRASPEDLCTTSTSSFNNSIVLAQRGSCTFIEKVFNAQYRNASGVIIGNNNKDDDTLIRMGSNKTKNEPLIPSVFVTQHDYEQMVILLNFGSSPDDLAWAFIDERGEVNASDNLMQNNNMRIAGILLLAVPAIWCAFAAVFFLRRCVASRINRLQRNSRNRNMTTITYRRDSQDDGVTQSRSSDDRGSNRNLNQNRDESVAVEVELDVLPQEHSSRALDPTLTTFNSSSSSSSLGQRPKLHNESCAICLDDFEDGAQIKILPCFHGFHSSCIDPWINERSDLCPICKTSILRSQPTSSSSSTSSEGGIINRFFGRRNA